MSKKKSYKVMPILAIVFYGVALILLLVKTGLFVAQSTLASGQMIVLPHLRNTALFMIPAVCFILHAAKRLNKSEKTKFFYAAALCIQSLVALVFAVKIAMENDDWTHFGKEIVLFVLFGIVFILCLIAFILVLAGKNARVLVIIAAAAGILIGFIISLWNTMFMLSYWGFYLKNMWQGLLRAGAYTTYSVGMVFHFTALIFSACFRKKQENKKVPVMIKK